MRTIRARILPFVLVLFLAAGLRFYRLDAQSFWNDEGNTARLVERPLPLIIEGAAGDIHPPGYYLLLHMWRGAVGESEFALRSFSALCGVLTVAIVAAIGLRASGREAALGAALFTAVHPLSVYYGQEARMYAQLGLVSALTLWAAVNFVEGQRTKSEGRAIRYVFLLAMTIACGLYTQYAYLFVLIGLNLAFGLDWLLRRPWRWRIALIWIATHFLAGLAFLPWAPIAVGASGWRPPDLDTSRTLQALARTLIVGITLPEGRGGSAVVAAAVLVLLACFVRVRSRFATWAALGMGIIPPTLILVLGLYRPAYLKFLMVSVAPLGVVLALPLSRVHGSSRPAHARPSMVRSALRWIAAGLFLFMLPSQWIALRHLYTDPAYARDDYRGLAAQIAAEGRLGDAIVLSAPNQWEVFTYYYRGPLPVYPAPYRPTQPMVAAWIDEITAHHPRLFVLFWGDTESDPERFIEPYLAQHAYKAGDVWVSTVRLARYGTAPLPETPGTWLDVHLGTAITLEGYAMPDKVYAPGDIIPLTLFWRAEAPPEQRFKVFVHVLDAAGTLVAQTDAEPGGGFALTSLWLPGEQVIDRYGVRLPDGLSHGEYELLVGMYAFSGERLPVVWGNQAASDAVTLTALTVTSPR